MLRSLVSLSGVLPFHKEAKEDTQKEIQLAPILYLGNSIGSLAHSRTFGCRSSLRNSITFLADGALWHYNRV